MPFLFADNDDDVVAAAAIAARSALLFLPLPLLPYPSIEAAINPN
jgi:hypothetical protein